MTARVWETESGRCVRTWGPFVHETDSCAVDGVRGRLILGCDDGKLRCFDLETGEELATREAHGSGIKQVAIDPNSGRVIHH